MAGARSSPFLEANRVEAVSMNRAASFPLCSFSLKNPRRARVTDVAAMRIRAGLARVRSGANLGSKGLHHSLMVSL